MLGSHCLAIGRHIAKPAITTDKPKQKTSVIKKYVATLKMVLLRNIAR